MQYMGNLFTKSNREKVSAQTTFFNVKGTFKNRHQKNVVFFFTLVGMSVDASYDGFFKSIYKNKAFRSAFEKTASNVKLQGTIRQALTRHCRQILIYHIQLTEQFNKAEVFDSLLLNCIFIHRAFADIIAFMQIHDSALLAYFRKEYAGAHKVNGETFKALEIYFKEVREAMRFILRYKHKDTITPAAARAIVQDELREREKKMITYKEPGDKSETDTIVHTRKDKKQGPDSAKVDSGKHDSGKQSPKHGSPKLNSAKSISGKLSRATMALRKSKSKK